MLYDIITRIIKNDNRLIMSNRKVQTQFLRHLEGEVMNITDVRVRLMQKEGPLKAVASITIDAEFVVHDIKIVEGDKGLFIAMPSRKTQDGEFKNIAHPINSESRANIQALILDKYQEELEKEVSE